MTRSEISLALAMVVSAVACKPPIPEGRFVCATSDDCPSGWACDETLHCSSSPLADSGMDAGDSGSDSGPSVATRTIYEIQDPLFAVGTQVTVTGAVVTAIDTLGVFNGYVYVQDPAGGPFSGIVIGALNSTKPADLAIGDVITVTGAMKDEFAAPSDTSGRTMTRLVPAATGSLIITRTGTTTPITPTVVDPIRLATSDAEAEKWSGVLVRMANVKTLGVPAQITSDATYKGVDITGPIGLRSALVPIEIGGVTLASGTCLSSLTGVFEYFFTYTILPRAEGDFVVGASTACATETTIAPIQLSSVPLGTRVHLRSAVVTAIFAGIGLPRVWVSDAAASAPNGGILVYNPIVVGTSSLQVGDVVDVDGTSTEFNNLTELAVTGSTPPTIYRTTAPAVTPVPYALALADFADLEPFESVLVSMSPSAVDGPEGGAGTYTVTRVGGGAMLVDDFIFTNGAGFSAATCLGTLAGVIDFLGGFRLHPRTAADVVTGGVCN
jgi:hypothetical protein